MSVCGVHRLVVFGCSSQVWLGSPTSTALNLDLLLVPVLRHLFHASLPCSYTPASLAVHLSEIRHLVWIAGDNAHWRWPFIPVSFLVGLKGAAMLPHMGPRHRHHPPQSVPTISCLAPAAKVKILSPLGGSLGEKGSEFRS